jgi:glycosyltransferase involved in cell wall biosynthesis
MRILQLIQKKQLRGAEVFACQLSKELIKLGHEVKMVALLDGDADMPFDGEVDVLNIDMGKRMLDYAGWRKLNAIIRAFKPDIVQANAGDTLKYASLSKYWFGWKAKLVFRNANKMSDFLNASWKRRFNQWLFKQVDFVASVSEECKLDFVHTFRWPLHRIETLPIGVDGFKSSAFDVFADKGRQDRHPILLSVAGFVKEKNHEGLIRIYERVRKVYPEALLIMIGEGKLQEYIASICRERNLMEHVWLTGRRSDVPGFMQRSHALLMPSIIEGLPGVILEAFVNRLPVVAYNVGGIPEVLINHKTGWLIEKGNETAFADAVIQLVSQTPHELERIKDSAARLVKEAYHNSVITQKFETAYFRILEKKTETVNIKYA